VRIWTGFIWLMRGSKGGLLFSSQQGLYSMELVTQQLYLEDKGYRSVKLATLLHISQRSHGAAYLRTLMMLFWPEGHVRLSLWCYQGFNSGTSGRLSPRSCPLALPKDISETLLCIPSFQIRTTIFAQPVGRFRFPVPNHAAGNIYIHVCVCVCVLTPFYSVAKDGI